MPAQRSPTRPHRPRLISPRRRNNIERPDPREKVYLVNWRSTQIPQKLRGGISGGDGGDDRVEELAELAVSAGAKVAGVACQRSPHPDPATLVGRGKIREVLAAACSAGASTVLFDHDLTPTQLRNLEKILQFKVIDRTQLILDIFARRARTREGKLQVELAQLEYMLPRLAGRGLLLSRLGGGIGTRGPGEQQLEFDRRRIRARIRTLKQALERVRSQRALHRAHRRKLEALNVALVGYTNAGKSTLFNALTGARAAVSPRLFATLDPAVRSIRLNSRRLVLISDTVGFIRDLPPHLVVAFRATLEELETADLLLHVSDAAAPDCERREAAVESLLLTLGVASKPRLRVWNKMDLLPSPQSARSLAGPHEVAISARTGMGLDSLLQRIDESLNCEPLIEASFELSAQNAKGLELLDHYGVVLSKRFEDGRWLVRARVSASLRRRIEAGPVAGCDVA